MTRDAPLRLSHLAAQSLLVGGSLSLPTLQDLPVGLFPPLLEAALQRGCMDVVGQMVQLWPFPCLHLGPFIKEQRGPLLEAVLDGLKPVPAGTMFPTRSKLKVLDLTWDGESVPWEEGWETSPGQPVITHRMENPQKGPSTPICAGHGEGDGHSIQIHADLSFCMSNGVYLLSPFTSYIVLRVACHPGGLRLCCRTLVIKKVTCCDCLQLHGCLEQHDFSMDFDGCLSLLSSLGHLRKLRLIRCTSWKLRCLLRSLKEPLQSLVITKGRLTTLRSPCFSSSIQATCLKELVFSHSDLSQVVPGPLAALLSEVSGTLEHLSLSHCGLQEAHLTALLPALCSCAHLRHLVLAGNVISTAGLLSVLQGLAGLTALKRVWYPVPAECKGRRYRDTLARVHAALRVLLQDLQRGDLQLLSLPFPRSL